MTWLLVIIVFSMIGGQEAKTTPLKTYQSEQTCIRYRNTLQKRMDTKYPGAHSFFKLNCVPQPKVRK